MEAAFFKNDNWEREMKQNGYILIKSFLPQTEVKELLALYRSLHVNWKKNSGQWNTIGDISPEIGLRTSNEILKYLVPKAERIFDNWKMPVATFLSKYPGNESMCDMHRDFSLLDETTYEYRNLWIPLIDINSNNGALFVLPGSHKRFTEILPMVQPWMHRNHLQVLTKYIKPIYAKAGDLIVYSDRMVHGSFKNLTKDTRPVVHLGVLPKNAQTFLYYLNGNKIEVYAVSPEYFFNHDLGTPPANVSPDFVLDYTYPSYSTAEIEKVVKECLNSVAGESTIQYSPQL